MPLLSSTLDVIKLILSNISNIQTWIQDLLLQDQDQDSEVPRPRPRLRGSRPRPRPRLSSFKTKTKTKTLMSKTKTETQDLQDQNWKSMTVMDCDKQND